MPQCRRTCPIPGSIENVAPAGERAKHLGAAGDGEEDHARRPHGLEAFTSLTPLIQQRQREDEGEQRRQSRQDNGHWWQRTFLGWDELVSFSMQAIAQAPARHVAGQWHRTHDLANLREPAEIVATAPGPNTEVVAGGVELMRTRVEWRAYRPRWRGFGRNDVEQRHAERRAGDHLAATRTADGVVLIELGGDGDAVDLAATEPARHAGPIVSRAPQPTCEAGPPATAGIRRHAGTPALCAQQRP